MVFWVLIAACVLSLAWFFVHLIMGGRDIAAPLRASDIDIAVRETAYLCWHITSWTLLAIALFFGLALWSGQEAYIVAATILAGGVAVVGIAMAPMIGMSYARLPQGWLFVPTAALGGLALWL